MIQTIAQKGRKHPIAVMLIYFVLYDVYFSVLEAWNRPTHLVHCTLDDYMPFCSWAVLPYLSWFVWVPAILFLFLWRSREEFWRLFNGLMGGTTFSLLLYTVYPTVVNLRRPLYGTDFCTRLIHLIRLADTPTNVCPSLHVFISALLLLHILNAQWTSSGTFRVINTWIAVLICASTVLIDQHSLIDVAFGVLLALWTYALTARAAQRQTSRLEVLLRGADTH